MLEVIAANASNLLKLNDEYDYHVADQLRLHNEREEIEDELRIYEKDFRTILKDYRGLKARIV